MIDTIYLAGGCLWGVQHFMRSVPGVVATEAGRANGTSNTLDGEYDGYAECVKVDFDTDVVSVSGLMEKLFEIINPYSLDEQGMDKGHKYRTGVYSNDERHLSEAREFIGMRADKDRIALEVLPLINYVRSADEHQDRLLRCPEDYNLCHIPLEVMNKYR